MPIYEYGCSSCKIIFQFWTSKVGTNEIPLCPKCGNGSMQKIISSFAIGKGEKKNSAGSDTGENPHAADPFENMSPEQQAKAEKEMMKLMSEADSLNENDPKQMGAFMRKLTENTGIDMGPGMNEAIRRLEKGEDPEKIEEDIEELFSEFDEAGPHNEGMNDWSYDNTLYDM